MKGSCGRGLTENWWNSRKASGVKLEPKAKHTIEAVVDRLVMDEKIRVRLSDSVETALKWGEGILLHVASGAGGVQSPKSKVQSG